MLGDGASQLHKAMEKTSRTTSTGLNRSQSAEMQTQRQPRTLPRLALDQRVLTRVSKIASWPFPGPHPARVSYPERATPTPFRFSQGWREAALIRPRLTPLRSANRIGLVKGIRQRRRRRSLPPVSQNALAWRELAPPVLTWPFVPRQHARLSARIAASREHECGVCMEKVFRARAGSRPPVPRAAPARAIARRTGGEARPPLDGHTRRRSHLCASRFWTRGGISDSSTGARTSSASRASAGGATSRSSIRV
jgi:hypothetical protein